jgi:protein tyrosine phosphatase (PTP) superfamily phosphohydrolase (DUF442 family)
MRSLTGLFRWTIAGVICLCAGMVGCNQNEPASPAADAHVAATAPSVFLRPVADQVHLPNSRFVTDKVISGAQPEGNAAFEALKKMGVETIVTVDGAMPDVERAHKFGLRYVHLPISYAGVKPEEGKAIAKALEELPGLIYIHCHHGKHRSAAAVTVACVENGTLAPERALTVLQTFGTGENYKGLWAAAREARPVPQEELKKLKVDYVEKKKIGPLAETMVSIDERFDHIKAIQKAGWQTPKDNPDLDPPHEALQLEELLHEIGRTETAHTKFADFSRMLAQGDSEAKHLRTALSTNPPDRVGAEAAFKQLGNTCASCHKVYRDDLQVVRSAVDGE